ncbi:hypothetical protein OF83DRAFT_1091072 [Amylostereum chailletii]|nr:hypothetical protein OF83DRAFT_1091072 [Amylostereum chailletii]
MEVEYQHMNEILPGLWVGDMQSVKDVQTLQENNIHSVLSAMRGKVAVNETFLKRQILLDDTEDADVLQHLIPAITFIQAELEKGRGVLVHCQAGMSRSATLAAAYVMYSKGIDVQSAIELIQKARPTAQPNIGFMNQLEIFHQASFKVSRRDKATRMFYLERAVEEIMNGDGSPETDMFAKFPRTPSDSAPATPGGPRRRIRCKMCRIELASREHMLDHGQLGPPTPAMALSPSGSRRPSMNDPRPAVNISRRPSASSRRPSVSVQPRSRLNSSVTRRPSIEGGVFVGLAASLSMSALETEDDEPDPGRRDGAARRASVRSPRASTTAGARPRRPSAPESVGGLHGLSTLSMSALDSDDDDDDEVDLKVAPKSAPITKTTPDTVSYFTQSAAASAAPVTKAISDTVQEDRPTSSQNTSTADAPTHLPPASSIPTALQHPSDIAAQLYANPKLAALRSPAPLGMTPIQSHARPVDKSSISPPILMNNKCSGYFVEPMEWMEFFLQDGQLAGKILCPNKKCGAKLGNYDWAGVCCSCKEWVVPGFCIHRSKVDEIV